MSSLKGNIILNGINTATSLLYPIITFPYAARVLMPEGIGAVNFLNSVISYIVLLTGLGIPMYAVKEVAKYRDNLLMRDKITVEILLLSLLLCIGGYVAVWALARFVPQIHSQCALFYVLSLSILFNTIGINWFYQAIEDFKFITLRALIIRTLSAVALFIFVKSPSDILIYGFIIVGSTVGNNIINLIHLSKFIDIKPIQLRSLNLTQHVKPAISVFVLNLIISLYVQLNTIMLGFMSGDVPVGFYTGGTKISLVVITLITSIGTALLPRCTNLIQKGEIEEFNRVIRKSLKLTILLSFPMTAGLMILSSPVIYVFCGASFIDSVPVLLFNAPIIIFVCITNITGIQVLYPMDRIKLVIISVTGGAAVNIILNIFLISEYNAVGASIGSLFAELAVLVIQLKIGRKYYPFSFKDFFDKRCLLATIVMCPILYLMHCFIPNPVKQLVLIIPTGIIIYLTVLYFTKEQMLIDICVTLRNKLFISKREKIN